MVDAGRPEQADLVLVAPEVANALARNEPVVGFETTILSFGLPQPLNAEVGEACEAAARAEGAVPATLALLGGRIRAGLDAQEVAFFASRDASIRKVNLQNFAAVLHARAPGALTVATSMQVAAMAGIRVFATGGIGGVHRGYDRVPDISSDLVALSRFPVVTVCAGAKSILDVGATLEALETLGVPVVGYQAESFPLFHARQSGHKLETNFQDAAELADFIRVHRQVSSTGVLVVTPVPEEAAIAPDELNRWIQQALDNARQKQVTGKQVTPYLLSRLENLSGGRTLEANVALIKNNARLAALIAREL